MLKLRVKKVFAHVDIQSVCKYCQNNDIVYDKSEGNLVCRNCGKVNSMNNFQIGYGDYQRTRAINPLLGSIGLNTCSSAGFNNYNSREKRLKNALKKINEMCESINLVQKFIFRAKEIYKKLWDKRALKGKLNKTVYAACIYVACKLEGSQRTFNEIVVLSRVNRRDLGKCFKHVKKTLNLNFELNVTSISHTVNRFCNHLNLSNKITKVIRYCCNKIDELSKSGKILEFQGKNPDTITSNVIYFICKFTNEKKTAKDISKFTGKNPGVIRKYGKELLKYKNVIIPEEFIKKYNI